MCLNLEGALSIKWTLPWLGCSLWIVELRFSTVVIPSWVELRTLCSHPNLFKKLWVRERLPGIETVALREFESQTFPGVVALKEERNRALWNAVFNITLPYIDEKAENKGIARYTSTQTLLVKHMGNRDNKQFAKACAVMDVWLRWIAAVFKVVQAFS